VDRGGVDTARRMGCSRERGRAVNARAAAAAFAPSAPAWHAAVGRARGADRASTIRRRRWRNALAIHGRDRAARDRVVGSLGSQRRASRPGTAAATARLMPALVLLAGEVVVRRCRAAPSSAPRIGSARRAIRRRRNCGRAKK
jgi:hypothetical protein